MLNGKSYNTCLYTALCLERDLGMQHTFPNRNIRSVQLWSTHIQYIHCPKMYIHFILLFLKVKLTHCCVGYLKLMHVQDVYHQPKRIVDNDV
jgi:hypothetical protein